MVDWDEICFEIYVKKDRSMKKDNCSFCGWSRCFYVDRCTLRVYCFNCGHELKVKPMDVWKYISPWLLVDHHRSSFPFAIFIAGPFLVVDILLIMDLFGYLS